MKRKRKSRGFSTRIRVHHETRGKKYLRVGVAAPSGSAWDVVRVGDTIVLTRVRR